jgi:hypothetical protein
MQSDEMDPARIDAAIRKLAAERDVHAREARQMVGELLRQAPVRWIDRDGTEALELELPGGTLAILREVCELVTGMDGHRLEDDRLVGLLALAVLRHEDSG